MKFNVYELKNSSVLYLYAQRSKILINPDYQRMGDIWTLDKKQLLIDTIINNFDVPKIYFHDLLDYNKKSKHEFAIVDGRQRLEAIWGFINGDFALADDFEYLRNTKIKAAGLTYAELASDYPQIKQLFDSSSLSVHSIQTDDLELIEEMFSRLNEAVPLNAAEKRNAFGGPLPKICREISGHQFFTKNLKISDKRYQHRDVAAKLLFLTFKDDVADTKKIYLDNFFRENKSAFESHFSSAVKKVKETLAEMQDVFVAKDKLLKSSGMVVLYFLLFRDAYGQSWRKKLTRSKMNDFETRRIKNRKSAELDITKADYDLLEFDRLTQTPNDQYAIRFRLDVLKKFIQS
ncbi:MAG: DUF262 domain-containing protein [Rhodospirillaceae bacterium]|nr:DUF262 domain-containing protein [Rhodospirillaceae bacterium]